MRFFRSTHQWPDVQRLSRVWQGIRGTHVLHPPNDVTCVWRRLKRLYFLTRIPSWAGAEHILIYGCLHESGATSVCNETCPAVSLPFSAHPCASTLMHYINTRVWYDVCRTMSFVLPKDISAEDAPAPRDPSVRVDDVDDGELLAVRDFPGELSGLTQELRPAYGMHVLLWRSSDSHRHYVGCSYIFGSSFGCPSIW